MAGKKITVVISQSQGRHPVKRALEEELATQLIMQPDIDVSLVPHLYDMPMDHTGMLFLRSVPGNVIVLGWLYPRAIRWTLDRADVRGHEGLTLLKEEEEDEDDDAQVPNNNGIGSANVPNRRIYCIDLRVSSDVNEYVKEIRRIADENSMETVDLLQFINGQPKAEQLQRYLNPTQLLSGNSSAANGNGNGSVTIDDPKSTDAPKRRWYPVIDYGRCTNCMECIDFCLFGVYGVDQLDRILVEEQDNCKKGCPACSRVCPENAIIFPQHKTSAIAGADGDVAGIKIDLSKLFGGDSGESALDMALKERDTELVADGREAVGAAIGVSERAKHADRERDALDDLMDDLDALDF